MTTEETEGEKGQQPERGTLVVAIVYDPDIWKSDGRRLEEHLEDLEGVEVIITDPRAVWDLILQENMRKQNAAYEELTRQREQQESDDFFTSLNEFLKHRA